MMALTISCSVAENNGENRGPYRQQSMKARSMARTPQHQYRRYHGRGGTCVLTGVRRHFDEKYSSIAKRVNEASWRRRAHWCAPVAAIAGCGGAPPAARRPTDSSY